ncbi:hypothetical protein V4U86_06665 [Mycobacterium sp. AMU20-3851]|uniref:hypothetical protein n=1 Tax=Mycobacterium sp. AMU20-3851 TaxID=3122055 RepID=UPI00375475F2
MAIDGPAARRFVYLSARLLDRHRMAALLDDAPVEPILKALAAYRNPDGGYGHALEPDVRGPNSETTSTLHALEILDEIGALSHPLAAVSDWVTAVADPDGGVPFALRTSAGYPMAPWMAPVGGSHLTFGLAGLLGAAGDDSTWLRTATHWCWRRTEDVDNLGGYTLKFALAFLDRAADADRAARVIETLRPLVRADGSVPVQGGTPDEALSALTLSPQPGLRSRALFSTEQIETGLDALEAGQQDDGGWLFDWSAWAPAQSTEWRGLVTLRALQTLRANGRI